MVNPSSLPKKKRGRRRNPELLIVNPYSLEEKEKKEMSKEEAEQLLSTLQENPEKFAKMKQKRSAQGKYRPQKDW